MSGATDQAKQTIRERVWSNLEAAGVVERGVHGYIPAFVGADQAAERLADLDVWRDAAVIKAVPDRAQLPVRKRALEQGKLVYMAVPRLAEAQPFYLLDPDCLTVTPTEAADREVAARIAPRVNVNEMQPIDLVICGSVAVNRHGTRLGKGAGYSDIEVALLVEAGLLTERTTIVTTVHELQVLDEELPEEDHDFRMDVIITPSWVIACGAPKRPAGLNWGSLSPERVAAIPVLQGREGL